MDDAIWLRSQQVLRWVKQDRPELFPIVHDHLRAALEAGAIRSRAKLASGTPNSPGFLVPVGEALPSSVANEPWLVPKVAWSRGTLGEWTSRFSLELDLFETHCPTSGYQRLVLRGLTFARDEFAAFFEIEGSAAQAFVKSRDGLKGGETALEGQGHLPSHASKSDRQHEAAAHAVAKIVRSTRCSVSEGIRQARGAAPQENRTDESIDRAIRRSYSLMYDRHGLVLRD